MKFSKAAENAARELKVARENVRKAKKNKASQEEIKALEKIVADKTYFHHYIIDNNM